MKFGIFGTGGVARSIADKLSSLGHPVVLGTRDPAATSARSTPDGYGNPPFRVWHEAHPAIQLGTFALAAAHGDILVNATVGSGSVEALNAAGTENLGNKVLVDVSNPLDFSRGFPPTLSSCNTDSLGEQIQRAFPNLRVVKTLNTVNAQLMVAPQALASGDHSIFLSGNDADAKTQVRDLLQSFGWKDIIDLGDITTARGTEMYLPLWVRLFQSTKTPMFSIKVVR